MAMTIFEIKIFNLRKIMFTESLHLTWILKKVPNDFSRFPCQLIMHSLQAPAPKRIPLWTFQIVHIKQKFCSEMVIVELFIMHGCAVIEICEN